MHLNKYFNSVCCKEVYWTVEHATQAPKKLPSNETVSEPVKGMLSSSEFFFPKKSAPIGPWRIEHTFLGDGFRCVPFTHQKSMTDRSIDATTTDQPIDKQIKQPTNQQTNIRFHTGPLENLPAFYLRTNSNSTRSNLNQQLCVPKVIDLFYKHVNILANI